MEKADEIKIIKKVRSLVYNRYNWASIAIAIQFLGATVITTGLQFLLMIIMLAGSGTNPANISFGGLMGGLNEYNIFLTGIAYVISNTTGAFLCMKLSRAGSIKMLLKKPEKPFGVLDVILATVAILGLSTFDSLIMTGLDVIFGSSSETLEVVLTGGMLSDKLWLRIGSVAYIAVLGPITEELLLRATCLPLCSHISTRFGIVASAVLFGIMHGNLTQFFNGFVLGLLLAYVTVKSRSVLPAMIMHVANNTLATIQTYMAAGMTKEAYQKIDTVSTIVYIGLGLAALVFLIIRKGKADDRNDAMNINMPAPADYIELAKTPTNNLTAKTFFSTWAFWVITVYALFNTVLVIIIGNSLTGM